MQVLGRLASRIAVVLQGKDKPTYTPHEDKGDICVVVNAKDITLTGNKLTDKKYYWHTGYAEVKEFCTEIIPSVVSICVQSTLQLEWE